MSDIMKQLAMASEEFGKLRGLLSEALKLDLDPGTRQYLQSLGTAMDQSLADVRDAVPKAAAQLDREVKEVQDSIAGTQKDLADVDAKIAELESAPPPVPPAAPVEPAIDPRRGKLLRDELLGRFGPQAAAAGALQGRDVHDMTSGDFRDTGVPQVPPAASAPATPVKPPGKRGKDAFDISSGTWERDE